MRGKWEKPLPLPLNCFSILFAVGFRGAVSWVSPLVSVVHVVFLTRLQFRSEPLPLTEGVLSGPSRAKLLCTRDFFPADGFLNKGMSLSQPPSPPADFYSIERKKREMLYFIFLE